MAALDEYHLHMATLEGGFTFGGGRDLQEEEGPFEAAPLVRLEGERDEAGGETLTAPVGEPGDKGYYGGGGGWNNGGWNRGGGWNNGGWNRGGGWNNGGWNRGGGWGRGGW